MLKHIAHRLIENRLQLSGILGSKGSPDFCDFQEQETLIERIQAGVRALDILEDHTPLHDDEERKLNSTFVAAVCMAKLANAEGPYRGPHEVVRRSGPLRLRC